MALPFWPFVRFQATDGTLVGVGAAAVFLLASRDLPTGPLVTWTLASLLVCSVATTLTRAGIEWWRWRRVIVRDDPPGDKRGDIHKRVRGVQWRSRKR